MKKKVKKIKPFRPELRPTKNLAWAAYSLYIRSKYYLNGTVECYTCGNKFLIGKISAGHGIPGRTNAVLFMEEVTKPQCFICNIRRNGYYRVFTPKLIAELGEAEYDRLAKIAQGTVKYTPWEYLEIEQKYLQKLWDLEN